MNKPGSACVCPTVLAQLAVAFCAVVMSAIDPVEAAKSNIDPRRSLVVTEQPILARFSFQRVLDQLVAQSRVPGLTALDLFHQWFDTQNPAPGLGLGRNCDTEVEAGGTPILNTYPYLCRPAATQQEGLEVTLDPFADPDNNSGAYIPVGLFNRFDLAPANGAHCGEHRIVYARRSGIASGTNRNLIIFEATLPNPRPDKGLKGCHKIVKFWADLSAENDIEKRADLLEDFYFAGFSNIPPVVHVNHYGNNPAGLGQIRTNQFMQATASPKGWNLREFKLIRTCGGGICTALKVVPVTDKINPFGPLFSPTGTHPQTVALQQYFVTQAAALSASTLAKIDMKIPDVFNTGQSLASGSTENDYVTQFGPDSSTLRTDIQNALTAIGSTLTPDHIVARAQALSCAGCHRLNANPSLPGTPNIGGGLVWPASRGFTHVAENATETIDGVTRFLISPALLNEFLPVRKRVVDNFLNDKPPNAKHPKDPIGGRRVH
jgi:hypothetical protein